MDTYQDFLKQNPVDEFNSPRQIQQDFVDNIRKADPRFSDLTEGQTGQVLAQLTGEQGFNRFSAGALNRGFDWLGDKFTNTLNELPVGGGLTASQYAGEGAQGFAQIFGAGEDTQQAFKSGGEQLPTIIGMLGLGGVGSVIGGIAGAIGGIGSVIGGIASAGMTGLMGATMYGQGVGSAYEQGATGLAPTAVGATSLATLAIPMVFSRAIADVAGTAALKLTASGALKDLTAEAVKDGVKFSGSEAVNLITGNPAVSTLRRSALKTVQESIAMSTASALSISSAVAGQLIINPKKFVEDQLTSKQFWIPTLIGETFNGVGGVMMGRMREPVKSYKTLTEEQAALKAKLHGSEQASAEEGAKSLVGILPDKTAGTEPSLTVPLDETMYPESIYSSKIKKQLGIPAGPESDQALLSHYSAIRQANAEAIVAETNKASTDTPESPAVKDRVINTPDEAYAAIADVMAAHDPSSDQLNMLGMAVQHLQEAMESTHPEVSTDEAFMHAVEEIHARAYDPNVQNYEHIVTTDDGNHIAFHNPGTKEVGTFVQVMRTGEDGKVHPVGKQFIENVPGTATILRLHDVLQLAKLDAPALKPALDKHFGVDVTPKELEVFHRVFQRTAQAEAEMPYGVSFHEDYHAQDPRRAAGIAEMLHRTGMQKALVALKQKLRFTASSACLDPKALDNATFDYFGAKNIAAHSLVENTNGELVHVISRNNTYGPDVDIHELGHVLHVLIDSGGYGKEMKAEVDKWLGDIINPDSEWNKGKERGKQRAEDVKHAAETGATIASKVQAGTKRAQGLPDTEEIRQHYLSYYETFAQTFHGYMMSAGNKFSDFMAKHFPTLHGFFSEYAKAFKTGGPLNRYSPGYSVGKSILKTYLDAHYDATEAPAKRLHALMDATPGMSSRVAEALVHEWFQAKGVGIRDALETTVKQLKETGEGVSDSSVIDLLSSIGRVNGETNMFSPMEGYDGQLNSKAFILAPWISHLVGETHLGWDKMLSAAKELAAKTGKPFKSEKWFNSHTLATELGFKPGTPRHAEAQSYLNGRCFIMKNIERLQRVVDVILNPAETERYTQADVLKQIYKLDGVLRDWYLGRLDYQKGKPMYEPTWDKLSSSVEAGRQHTIELPEREAAFVEKSHKSWFPDLTDALMKRVKNTAKPPKSHLDIDGNFDFETKQRESGTKRPELKSFSSEQEARDYVDSIQNSSKYAMVELSTEHYTKRTVAKTREEKLVAQGKYKLTDAWRIVAKDTTNRLRLASEDSTWRASKQAFEAAAFEQAPEHVQESQSELESIAAPRPQPTKEKRVVAQLSPESAKQFWAELEKTGAPALHKLRDIVPNHVEKALQDILAGTDQPHTNVNEFATLKKHFLGMLEWRKANPGIFNDLLHEHGVDLLPTQNGLITMVKAYVNSLHTFTPDLNAKQIQSEHLRNLSKMIAFGEDVANASNKPSAAYDPDTVTNFYKSLTNYVKDLQSQYLNESAADTGRGMIPQVTPSEQGRQAGTTAFATPLSNPTVQANVAAVLNTQEGNLGRPHDVAHERSAIGKIFGAVLGKPLSVAQKIHSAIGQGPLQRAVQDPNFYWASKAFYDETVNVSGNTTGALKHLHCAGKLVSQLELIPPDERANLKPEEIAHLEALPKIFKLDEGDSMDPNRTVRTMLANPRLRDIFNRIGLLENQGSDFYENIINKPLDPNDEISVSAYAYKKELSNPKEAALMEECLKRFYASHKYSVQVQTVQSMRNFIASHATSLISRPEFGNSAEKAMDFATRFNAASTPDRLQLLVKELNKTPREMTNAQQAKMTEEEFHQSQSTTMTLDDAERLLKPYMEAEQGVLKQNQMLLHNSFYTSEVRYGAWHVRVVFKEDGRMPASKTERMGYYGFNSLEEAQKFAAEQRVLGNTSGTPWDFGRAKRNYREINGTYEDALNDVTKTTRVMLELFLEGKGLDEETLNTVSNAIGDLPDKVTMQNEAVKINSLTARKRSFTKGREELDRFEQHLESVRRRLAASGRKETDIKFKLYSRDKGTLANNDLYEKLDEFKSGMRLKDSEYQKQIGMLGYNACMLGNLSSGIMEMQQGPIITAASLMAHGGSLKDAFLVPTQVVKYAYQSAMKRLVRGDQTSVWDNPEERAFIRDAVNKNRLAQRLHHDIDQTSTDRVMEQYRNLDGFEDQTTKDKIKSVGQHVFNGLNNMYGAMNRFNMEVSLISHYRLLRKLQYGNVPTMTAEQMQTNGHPQFTKRQFAELSNKVMMASDMANGTLQRLGRPEFFNTKSEMLRNAASTYWSLQSFVNAQVANQLLYMSKALNAKGIYSRSESIAARKAMATLLGMQFLAMGTAGFTLWPSANKAIKLATGFDPEEEMRDAFLSNKNWSDSDRQFMADFAANGLATAAGVPIDYGTRLSVQGLGPMSPYAGFDAKQLGGPVIGLVTQAMSDLKKVQEGTLGIGEAVTLNMLPVGLRRGLRMEMFDHGDIYDGNKKFMFTPTAVERVGMWTGFNTVRAREEMEARMKSTEAIDAGARLKMTRANAVIDAQASGNLPEAMRIMRQTATDFQEKVPAFAKYVAELKVSKDMGQLVREGSGPEADRVARLYQTLNPPQEMLRKAKTDNYMQQLGVPVVPNFQAYRHAAAFDSIMQNNPGITSGAASKMLSDPMRRGTIYGALDPNSATEAFQSNFPSVAW